MSLRKLKFSSLFLISYIVSISLNAQIDLSAHFDIGENNASEGIYMTNSDFAGFNHKKMSVLGGIRFNAKTASPKLLSGTSLKIGREITAGNVPFTVEAFSIYIPFSDWVSEFDWGLLAGKESKHFKFKLGTSFRTYSLTKMAKNSTGPQSKNKLRENFNTVYLIQYGYKPLDHYWNIGISITNIDYFLINQESNPLFNLNGKFEFTPSFSFFAEAWYKASGISNISVNYFGFFIRTGVLWKINLNKQD